MANDFVCNTPRCLVWETERPFLNETRDSPTFIYRGRKCCLHLFVGQSSDFCLVLKCKKQYLGVKNATTYMKSLVSNISLAQNSRRNFLWYYRESDLKESIPDLHQERLWRFCVLFDQDEISPDELTKDQTIQTPSHSSTLPCLESLSGDFSKLLEEGFSSHDVKLKCGDHTVGAHRNILSARSHVFAKMLKSDMTEGRTGVVEVQDMDFETLGHFLRYLCTGTLPELNTESARGLYEAGDKYAVQGLVIRCSDFLKKNLTPDNVCEMLVLADAHSDQLFKESVIMYILEKRIPLQSDHWEHFCSGHLMLANKVLNRFCKLLANVEDSQG